ncbi:ERF family protein [Streptomyces sp. NBC_01255]|uniref:ERF family protein n=1 Tax=Streptomyces sp. NBC_01255 TaxID=2903798 RepID=UPI002E378380|nr:ERF family protein [Streptomyces sp. NBC_01255]
MTVTTLPTAHPGQPSLPPVTGPADVTYEPAPNGAPVDAPRVFAAINSVMRDAMPVGKNQTNTQQNYKFRGIDDVMSAMAGPLRAHGVFILPSVASHKAERRGEKMTHVVIRMRYRIYGPAGDCLVADVPGEASDFADKATNKAQSAALKYLLFTLFMLPVDGRSIDDGDRHHPEVPTEHRAERQEQQRRQQQPRGQQRGQRQQQPRQGQQAEAASQQEQQRRDFKAEARAATSEAQFEQVRVEAVKAGAPAEYLAALDAIADGKRADARAPQPRVAGQQERPTRSAPTPAPDATTTEAQTGAAAEEALRLAASRVGYQTLDADFERAHGRTIAEADPATLHAFRSMIERAAQ